MRRPPSIIVSALANGKRRPNFSYILHSINLIRNLFIWVSPFTAKESFWKLPKQSHLGQGQTRQENSPFQGLNGSNHDFPPYT